MTRLLHRPYERLDADAVAPIINQAFSIDRNAKKRSRVRGALEVYWRTCLDSAYAQVAVCDSRVVVSTTAQD
ncbi:hypothetical protein [Xylanimonas ulmi]|uniref:Acetyltransferase (GNAT) family protein n=1 Tax=Xylanimonas ulmi TaxID=228973 RepID=A0A4V2EXM6_9MICO|nr:hypothetical protein [Xylanibacterium ulmi]RZS60020.1 hypothetical protein EV386_0260 [Xylanibacterium ulmi]